MNIAEVAAKGSVVASPPRVLTASVAFAVLLLLARLFLVEELQSVYFLTGWISVAFVLGLALSWWFPVARFALERRISCHLATSFALVVSFAIHTNFRMPGGWLDWGLTLWLALALVSLCLGRVLLTRRWLLWHVAISYGLAAACLVHGIHVHAHGLLAYWLVGK